MAGGLASLRPVAPTSSTASVTAPAAVRFRDSLGSALEAAPDRPAALLAGLTIGDTSGIDYSTTETFRRSGLAHLVAVSGSNVAMVLAALAIVTLGFPRALRAGLAAVALFMYVGIVGFEPSVLRAAAMGAVGLIGYIAGRDVMSLNSLGIALIAVIVIKPELVFSIGLHLSAAATLGIVVWSQPIEGSLRWIPALIRAPVSITLAAQIAVAPLLIIAFEQLSVVAPVANVLAAPAVPPATVIGLSSGLVGLVSVEAGRFLATLAAPFAHWILLIAIETGTWSWAAVDVPSVVGWVGGVPVGLAALVAAGRRLHGG